MTWFRLDDSWHNHPKVLAAGNAAAGLWVRCANYSAQQLTNGFIPNEIAQQYGTKTERDRVTGVGLWMKVEGGYFIMDYLEFNPSADQVKADRAAARERQRKSRESRRDSQRESRCESQDPDPTRPDPSPNYLQSRFPKLSSLQTVLPPGDNS